eukprot:SAG31_NODE_42043_length_273_cov_0.867816_1_plen_35_part_10
MAARGIAIASPTMTPPHYAGSFARRDAIAPNMVGI